MGLNRNLGNITEVIKESGGNIGIGTGTVAPVRELEVKGSVQLSSPTGSFILYGYGSTNDWGLGTDTGQSTRDFNLYNYNTASINLSVNRATGKVGIGTSSPTENLTISKTLPNTSSQDGGVLGLSNGYYSCKIKSYQEYWLDLLGLSFETIYAGVSYNRMYINSSGNVGIGTGSSVPYKLSIIAPPSGVAVSWTDTLTNTGYLRIREQAAAIGADDNLLLETAGIERLRVTSWGAIGINTGSSPTFKFQVNGSVGFRSDSQENVQIQSLTDPNRCLLMGYNHTGNYATLQAIHQNVGYKNIILNPVGGYIGIGTASPTAKLHVVGNTATYGAAYIGQNTNGTAYIDAYGGAAYFGNGDTAHALWILNNGNYAFTGSNVSDIRAKENIKDLDFNATEKVMNLKPKSYYMKYDLEKIRYGFIAQDVDEVLPDLTNGDADGEDYVGLDYNGIIPVLTKAIQEQQEIIKQLTNRIINLENK